MRMLGSNGGERRNAWAALERVMQSEGVNWSDIGNMIERAGEPGDGFTEAEMQEFAQAVRAEAIETGIKIGLARAGSGSGNGHLTLPNPAEMAQYCRDRRERLKDDKSRDFVGDMCAITQRGARLSPRRLGYLVSLYIQIGGRI
jgi:hypothetical protein